MKLCIALQLKVSSTYTHTHLLYNTHTYYTTPILWLIQLSRIQLHKHSQKKSNHNSLKPCAPKWNVSTSSNGPPKKQLLIPTLEGQLSDLLKHWYCICTFWVIKVLFNINHVEFGPSLALKSNAWIILMGKWIKLPKTHKRHKQSERNKSPYYHKILKSFAKSEFSISFSIFILGASKARYKNNGEENKIKMTYDHHSYSVSCKKS